LIPIKVEKELLQDLMVEWVSTTMMEMKLRGFIEQDLLLPNKEVHGLAPCGERSVSLNEQQ
jgi:hypothetical protein